MRVKIIAGTSILTGLFFILCSVAGCSSTKPAPTPADNAALEQAKTTAQNSEQKLAELRLERMKLEAALAKKQEELRKTESARDSLKAKTAPNSSTTAPVQVPSTTRSAVPADTMKKQLSDTLGQKKAR
jgi:hypothetical protein